MCRCLEVDVDNHISAPFLHWWHEGRIWEEHDLRGLVESTICPLIRSPLSESLLAYRLQYLALYSDGKNLKHPNEAIQLVVQINHVNMEGIKHSQR